MYHVAYTVGEVPLLLWLQLCQA